MKALLLALLIFLPNITSAAAPLGVSGQAQTPKLYPSVIQAPNAQITNLGAGRALIETGNDNLLVNASFEASNPVAGWTQGGTIGAAGNTSVVRHGAKSATYVPTAQSISLTQDSSLYAGAFADGAQGMVSIWIRSSVAMNLCVRQNGVTSALCLVTETNSRWKEYIIPVNLSSTSNGISITSTGNVTGTVHLDKAFVGPLANLPVIANLSTSTDWQTATFSGLSWQGLGGVTLDGLQVRREGPDLVYRGSFISGSPSASQARIPLPTNFGDLTISSTVSSGETTGHLWAARASLSVIYPLILQGTFNYMTVAGNVIVGAINPTVSINGNAEFVSGVRYVFNGVRIPIQGWGATSSSIVSSNEIFSTDTTPLVFAGATSLAALASAAVGTVTAYGYSINTNTRVQLSSINQTTSDMSANGLLIYARPYNAANGAGNPNMFAIQIGKGLKGLNIGLYKGATKVTSGTIDSIGVSSTEQLGLSYKDYDEKSGILIMDSGLALLTTNTVRSLQFSDGTVATSGYLVVNASRNPALTGLTINKVAVRAGRSTAQSIPSGPTTTIISNVVTINTPDIYNSTTGVATVTRSDNYLVSGSAMLVSSAWAAGNIIDLVILKNGTVFKAVRVVASVGTSTYGITVSDLVPCVAGDTLALAISHNRGTATDLASDAAYTNFSISSGI